MARRRNKNGLIELARDQPWQVNSVLACVCFAFLRWIVPSFFNGNPFLTALAKLSFSVAFIPLIFFGFFALIGLVRSKRIAKTTPTITGSKKEPAPRPTSSEDIRQNSDDHFASIDKSLPPFSAWSLDALRAMEWKRFELVTARYYDLLGFRSETIRCGADGGIDVKLFKSDLVQPVAIVQCKAWNTTLVGVKELRELLGVMTHEKIKRGIFITTGTYTKDAMSFGSTNPIQMLDGAGFLLKLAALPEQQQQELIQFAFEGDYTTPTCASCGIKMKRRESKRGPFWGCLNYPRCKSKFPITV